MIRTDRLELWPFTVESATAIAEDDRGELLWADAFPRDDDREAARLYLHSQHDSLGGWIVVEARSGEAIGTIGFFGPPDPAGDLMVGYGLVPLAHGKGYATEALRAVVDYGLAQPGVVRLIADSELTNTASHRVLEKCGFQRGHVTGGNQRHVRTR